MAKQMSENIFIVMVNKHEKNTKVLPCICRA